AAREPSRAPGRRSGGPAPTRLQAIAAWTIPLRGTQQRGARRAYRARGACLSEAGAGERVGALGEAVEADPGAEGAQLRARPPPGEVFQRLAQRHVLAQGGEALVEQRLLAPLGQRGGEPLGAAHGDR